MSPHGSGSAARNLLALRARLKTIAVDCIARLRLRSLSYNDVGVEVACAHVDMRGAAVLVVGAGGGDDCRRFIARGAREVHGLDVRADVGCDFQHTDVVYHCGSIEKADLPSNRFDLVFAVATMEHVDDIKSGFHEMVRLTKPGGIVFSAAAPLWNSRYGHHMGCLAAYPWIHLVMSADEIVAHARRNGITGERGHTIEAIVNYMMDSRFFNMRPACDYLAGTSALPVDIIKNAFDREPASVLDCPMGRRALAAGFPADELLSVAHRFVARKPTS